MQRLSKLLNKKLQSKTTFAKQVQSGLVVEYANQVIRELWGNKGAKQAWAVSLKNNFLKLACSSAIMAQELRFKQYKIQDAINKKFSSNTVKRVKIVQKGVEKSEN